MADFLFAELEGYAGVNNLTVIIMGLGVVFAGLIGLIIVCTIMGKICSATIKEESAEKPTASAPAAAPAVAPAKVDDGIADRGAFIAAVSAAIAEASGTDAAGLRIVKIEKLN